MPFSPALGWRLTATSPDFKLFPSLPLEIRQKIWFLALPDPRVLHVQQRPKYQPRNSRITRGSGFVADPITSPQSYGGHHPAILSVNKEARAEALRYLTPLFGAYWNLETDAPYFELPEGDNSREEVLLVKQMRETGQLDVFKHIAIDWLIWRWNSATHTMEYQVTFGTAMRDAYEHPIQILNNLPNIRTCAFVHTHHTLQKDLIKPYVPWHLGPLTTETTLDDSAVEMERVETQALSEISYARREDILRKDLEIHVLAIHNRERKPIPPKLPLRRAIAGWEMDWFG